MRLSHYQQYFSPFYNTRPESEVSLLVIHNISLPAGQFATPYVHDLFMGCLDCQAHASFTDLQGVEVSSHFVIDRHGQVSQFVDTQHRAWHAGVSSFQGRENCNDFAICLELEGTDDIAFTEQQYSALVQLSKELMAMHPFITSDNIVGHSDIAPGRKTDPGPAFDWLAYRAALRL